jgi:hypothetical protein
MSLIIEGEQMRKFLISILAMALLLTNLTLPSIKAFQVSENLTTINYTEDTSVFINPEKGFYKPFHSENIIASDLTSLKNKNISLILVETNLAVGAYGDYHQNISSIKNAELSDAKILEINNAFTLARNAGLKVVFRCAYDYSGLSAPEPTLLSTVEGHIAKLKDVLKTNEDVLYCVQAGFLGSWGEWHSTLYGQKDTEEDIDYTIKTIKDIVNSLRKISPFGKKAGW